MEPQLRTLFVHTPGTRLTLDGNSVRAFRDDAPPRQLPLEAIDTIVVATGVDVSNALLVHCAEAGRVVAFLSGSGRPRAIVEGAAIGRSELRRSQYAAHIETDRRNGLAADFVSAKLHQMEWALRQWARDAASCPQAELRELADRIDETRERVSLSELSRDELLGVEGDASRRYFAAMGLILSGADWHGRRRRPPTDPINAMLSWLYGMTRVAVQGAVMVAGLDPGTGFLHGDRAAQPSLVLDLMEEHRPTADRLAVRLWNTKRLQERHFTRSLSGGLELTDSGRELLFEAWHRLRATDVRVSGRKHPVTNGFVPIMQAHALAGALRHGERYVGHRRLVA